MRDFPVLDRRTLLKGTAAAAMLPLIGVKAAMAQPVRGGHMKLAMAGGSTSDSFDSRHMVTYSMYVTSKAVRNTLTEVSAENKLTNSLAESWESSDGAKKWICKIRKGVTFHSGKVLDANDVVASIRIHMDADSGSAAKPFLSSIVSFEADGPNTVVATLKSANVDFPSIFVQPQLCILPSQNGKVDPATHDGTGAYILDTLQPGVRIILRRNPNYWRADQGGFVESAEVIIVEDSSSRMNALRTGQVDVVNQVDLKTAALLKRVKGLKVEEVESGQHNVFPMLVDVPPFTDVNVRQALKYAINRQEILDKVLQGHGSLGNDSPICKFHKYFSKEIPQREYDPEKAKFYLKQANMQNLSVTLNAAEAGFQGAIDAGQLFAETAKSCGIEITVKREPNDGYFDSVWRKKPFTSDYWGFRLTEDETFTIAYAADAPLNETHWKNPRFNELLVAARGELDEGKRAEMYHDMQILVRDDGGSLIPSFTNHIWGTTDKISHGPSVASNWELDGLHCIERWWKQS